MVGFPINRDLESLERAFSTLLINPQGHNAAQLKDVTEGTKSLPLLRTIKPLFDALHAKLSFGMYVVCMMQQILCLYHCRSISDQLYETNKYRAEW